jgi:putative membrane protein
MKRAVLASAAVLPLAVFAASNPDSSFYKKAAEGGIAEVELGNLAQQKASNPSAKEFGTMMVTDHTAANEKLKAIAATKGIDLPTSPSVGQLAAEGKLKLLSGETFDKSYIKEMIDDHKEDIKEFEKEATSGHDPDAKAFAAATLPTLKLHLKKIESIAAQAGIKAD